MRVRSLPVLAILALVCRGHAQDVFRADVQQVVVFVTVRDSADRLVGDLHREDFRVLDNGRPVPPDLFDATPQPLNLLLLLDNSRSMTGSLPRLRDGATALITNMTTRDRTRIAIFSGPIRFAPRWSDDAQELIRMLPPTTGANETRLYDALIDALDAFDTIEGRRVIVVFSDGADTSSSSDRDTVVARARARDVMIYGVGLNSRYVEGKRLITRKPDPGLRLLARETGGGFVEADDGDGLRMGFERIADELHRQYLIAFTPLRHDGRVHGLTVIVAGQGLVVRARQSYIAPAAPPPPR